MATAYPGGIYSPRTKENKPGVVYNASKKTIGYVEDITKLDDEVVAIETELGTNPKGIYETVKAWLTALTSLLNTHASRHENGGDDEISVAGLSGELADDQPPKAHDLGGATHGEDTLANLNIKISDANVDDDGDPRDPNAHKASHQNGGGDEISVAGLSGELADDQPPKAHKSSHASGGSDPLTEVDIGVISTIAFIIDGGGAAIETGEKGHLRIPFKCEIQRATLLADQSGSIVVNIWKDTYANFPPAVADKITASAPPTISGAVKSEDSTLTDWTKTINADDILAFNVDSTATIERVTLTLKVKKT